jgi:ATP-dependent RNA helicase DDX24/MAK5
MKLKRQNFLFSATLITKFSSTNFEEENEKTDAQLKKEHKALLNSLVEKLQMTKEPVVFDLTTKAVTAEKLFESKIFCSLKDKDSYMYYFTCKYSGRTLVFANSIDCVRRLTNLFRLMKKEPLHLHADMNQKQRLKNLEKFNGKNKNLDIEINSMNKYFLSIKHKKIHF